MHSTPTDEYGRAACPARFHRRFKGALAHWLLLATAVPLGAACGDGSDVEASASSDAPTSGDLVQIPVASAGARMKVGTNFWNLEWGIWDDVFKGGATFTRGASPWRARFLQEVAPYAALRFMDFGQTNDSGERVWSDRTAPDAPAAQQTRLAYEWMIDLCNRLGRDMWVTVPHLADDDYAFRLASLIKRSLNPHLKVYVEWSNETWNTVFEQSRYASERGNALGLDADPQTAALEYHVYAAVRLFHQFDLVFGTPSRRVVKVLAGQSPNVWMTGVHMAALADPTINPLAVKADAYAIAPYFGDEVDGNAADAVVQLRASVPAVVDEVKQQYDTIAPTGLALLAYEGGQAVGNGADVVNGRPEMYQIYQRYLDGVAPYLDLFMHYVHNGEWSSEGAWGAEQFVGQPLTESPKLRAIFDWIRRHR
jgi:hypothetical protein